MMERDRGVKGRVPVVVWVPAVVAEADAVAWVGSAQVSVARACARRAVM